MADVEVYQTKPGLCSGRARDRTLTGERAASKRKPALTVAVAALCLAAVFASGCKRSGSPPAEYAESYSDDTSSYEGSESSDDVERSGEGQSPAARALDAYGLVLFKCAWPTARYAGYEILDEPEFNVGSDDVSAAVVRLEGNSAFNDGPLWVKVELSMSVDDEGEPQVFGLRFGDNNAVLAQPGTTLRSKFVADLSPTFQELVERVCPNP